MGDEFPAWLAEQLYERGWSMRELARRSGFSRDTVSKVINGWRSPSRDFCAAVARALGVSASEVLWRAGLYDERPLTLEQPELVDLVEAARRLPAERRAYLIAIARVLYHTLVVPGAEG